MKSEPAALRAARDHASHIALRVTERGGAGAAERAQPWEAYLNGIALRLNQRPRKTLGFETPANRLQLVLH